MFAVLNKYFAADADDDVIAEDDEETPAVQVLNTDAYGDILVGPDGPTLSMFDADEQGADESACYDDCAENWPPLTVNDESTEDDGPPGGGGGGY